jgi:DUF1365 family protein
VECRENCRKNGDQAIMDIKPYIFNAKVMHKRLFPKENKFIYNLYYLALPLPAPKIQRTFLRFDAKDLGFRDGSDPGIFAKKVLSNYGFDKKIENIMLITMPRVFGYVFNPVSFYFCFDNNKKFIAVIAEVHNTFGEQHYYFCANPCHSPINESQWLEAEKVFHVSPFLPRDGSYRFKFSLKEERFGIWIDYFDSKNNKQLMTSLVGNLVPLNNLSLNKAFKTHLFLTIKTILLIHLQALKLFCKKISYFRKPKQYKDKLSATLNIQKEVLNKK